MANIKQVFHSRQKEEMQGDVGTHYRQGLTGALGMPMTIFQLISERINKFSKSARTERTVSSQIDENLTVVFRSNSTSFSVKGRCLN
jgi:hypothetical protein